MCTAIGFAMRGRCALMRVMLSDVEHCRPRKRCGNPGDVAVTHMQACLADASVPHRCVYAAPRNRRSVLCCRGWLQRATMLGRLEQCKGKFAIGRSPILGCDQRPLQGDVRINNCLCLEYIGKAPAHARPAATILFSAGKGKAMLGWGTHDPHAPIVWMSWHGAAHIRHVSACECA